MVMLVLCNYLVELSVATADEMVSGSLIQYGFCSVQITDLEVLFYNKLKVPIGSCFY